MNCANIVLDSTERDWKVISMLIKSARSLCEDYQSMSKLAHESQEPIYITKDGEGDLVIMSIFAFENREKAIREQVEKEREPSLNDTVFAWQDLLPQIPRAEKGGNMTEYELGKILKGMYDGAPKGDQAAFIHLFGIKYADELSNVRLSKKEILKNAGLPESYQTEISKGVKLAKYVEIKKERRPRINFRIDTENLESLLQRYGQFGLDQLYITAKESVESGGSVDIVQEYINAPPHTLKTLKSMEEIKEFFKQQ